MFLSQFEQKLCTNAVNMVRAGCLANLFYKSGNPDGHTLYQALPFHSSPSKMCLGWKNMFLKQLEGKKCIKAIKFGENWQSGNPVVQIWQPWWSYTSQSASIRFLSLKNMGLVWKIIFLSQLAWKLCRNAINMVKIGNLATLLYKSGNPDSRTLL